MNTAGRNYKAPAKRKTDAQIDNIATFSKCLAKATREMRALVSRYPNDKALASIVRQLEHVELWIREGKNRLKKT